MAGLPTSGALTLRAGEPFVLNVALGDAQGVPQLLTGRAFLLTVSRIGANQAFATAEATLSPDNLYAVMSFNGDVTTEIYAEFASRAAEFAVIEIVGASEITRGSGFVTVQASPAVPSDEDPTVLMLPFTQALATPDALLITEMGARGLSAVEIYAIGGLDPSDPIAAEMWAEIQAPALTAASFADQATAATNQAKQDALDAAAAADQVRQELVSAAAGVAQAIADAQRATTYATEKGDAADIAAADATAATNTANDTISATETARLGALSATAGAVAATSDAEAATVVLTAAGAAVSAVAPLALEAADNARIVQAYAGGVLSTTPFVFDLVRSIGGVALTGPSHIWLDSAGKVSGHSNAIAQNTADVASLSGSIGGAVSDSAAAISTAQISFDLVRDSSFTGPRAIQIDSLGKVRYSIDPAPPTVAEITDEVISALPGGLFTDLVRRDSAAMFLLDSRGYVIDTFEGGGGASSTPVLDASDVGSYRDQTTGCSVPKIHFRSASRPVIILTLLYGQSLAISEGDDVYTTTPAYPDDVIMLNGQQGCRAISYRPFTETGFTDAVEVIDGTFAESGMVGLLNRIAERVTDAIGLTPLLSGIVTGIGATPIRNLRRGTSGYEALLFAIQRVRDLADAIGYDVICPFMMMCEGNSDTSITSGSAYARVMITWRREFSEDVRQLLGERQPEQIIMYLDQPDVGSNSALSTLTVPTETGVLIGPVEAAQRDPYIRLVGAHGDIPKHDGVHPFSLGYLWIRERWAELIFKDYFCGSQPDFTMTKVWRKPGNKIGIYVQVPFPPLVIDLADTLMPAAQMPGLGFAFDDGSGAPPTISAVTLVNGAMGTAPQAELEITLSGAPTGPHWRLFHQMHKITSVWNNGMMTCIRDSSPAVSTFGVNGAPASGGNPGRPLFNFMYPQVVYF